MVNSTFSINNPNIDKLNKENEDNKFNNQNNINKGFDNQTNSILETENFIKTNKYLNEITPTNSLNNSLESDNETLKDSISCRNSLRESINNLTSSISNLTNSITLLDSETLEKKYTFYNNFFETIERLQTIIYEKSFMYHSQIRKIIILFFMILYVDFLLPQIRFITRTIFNYSIWFLLGILSSIGFGTGMQTGVLFVFPEIIAEYNRNLEYNNDPTSAIYYSYLMCLPFVLIWGIGTAYGELPPYYIASKINYRDSGSLDKMYKLLGDNSDTIKNNVKKTVDKFRENKNYSFITILCLSAWPNAMFDICGISAGLVKLNVYEFLIPTIIGKAFIKTPIQLGFILYSYANYGDSLTQSDEIGYLYYLWNTFVISFTLYVFKEYIESVVN